MNAHLTRSHFFFLFVGSLLTFSVLSWDPLLLFPPVLKVLLPLCDISNDVFFYLEDSSDSPTDPSNENTPFCVSNGVTTLNPGPVSTSEQEQQCYRRD